MIGLILVAHDKIAADFIKALEHVDGAPQEAIASLSVTDKASPADYHETLKEMIESLDQGDGIIILTDVYGSTPANIACRVIDHPNIEIINGMNLPMLVKLAELRKRAAQDKKPSSLHAIATEACNAARKNIYLATDVWKKARNV
ncbi:MAG: PTS fructose transporter subunit IIA [Alphaproteobacteria bacterium GM202ARS2]|nr:PTS fructose transporter subunit IIA [Alphaproteobacteria bacterium GM202ARS2]